MAKQSGFLARLEAERSVWFEQAETIQKQFMLDCFIVAAYLELGFAGKRLDPLIKRWGEIYSRFYPVFNTRLAECDVLRSELDALLQKALVGSMLDNPAEFEKRYPNIREVEYK